MMKDMHLSPRGGDFIWLKYYRSHTMKVFNSKGNELTFPCSVKAHAFKLLQVSKDKRKKLRYHFD